MLMELSGQRWPNASDHRYKTDCFDFAIGLDYPTENIDILGLISCG